MGAGFAQAGANARDARMGLVLIHGRGATAEGILDLGHALGLPDVALIAPQAPGMSWWPTSFLAPPHRWSRSWSGVWRWWMRLWTLL
jgi:hypothetical protein